MILSGEIPVARAAEMMAPPDAPEKDKDKDAAVINRHCREAFNLLDEYVGDACMECEEQAAPAEVEIHDFSSFCLAAVVPQPKPSQLTQHAREPTWRGSCETSEHGSQSGVCAGARLDAPPSLLLKDLGVPDGGLHLSLHLLKLLLRLPRTAQPARAHDTAHHAPGKQYVQVRDLNARMRHVSLALLLLSIAAVTGGGGGGGGGAGSEHAADTTAPVGSEPQGEGVTQEERSAIFGAAWFSQLEMSSSEEQEGFVLFVDVEVRLAQHLPLRPEEVSSVLLLNREESMRWNGTDRRTVVVPALQGGFYEVITLVVYSRWIGADETMECVRMYMLDYREVLSSPACFGIMALRSDKVNFYESFLLSSAISPDSLLLTLDAGGCASERNGSRGTERPSAQEIANQYLVNEEGDVLSDLLLVHSNTVMAFVSPKLPLMAEASYMLSSWRCEFKVMEKTRQGEEEARPGAAGDASMANTEEEELGLKREGKEEEGEEEGGEEVMAHVVSDKLHTFRVYCSLPSRMREVLRTGGEVVARVLRDGVAISRSIETGSTFRKIQWEQEGAEEEGSEEEGGSQGEEGGGQRRGEAAQADGAGGQYPVEVCTMLRDEEEFILEWVEYHLMIGVSHFHIYLHLTRDRTPSLLAPYVKRGQVTLRAWDFTWASKFMFYQAHALNDCLLRAQGRRRKVWLMMLDVDEFLVPPRRADVIVSSLQGLRAEDEQGGAEGGEQRDGEDEGGREERRVRKEGAMRKLLLLLADAVPQTVPLLLQRGKEMAGKEAPAHPSAIKLGWLTFSSHEKSACRLSICRFLLHAENFLPEDGKKLGDRQHGKVLVRAGSNEPDVHVDFPGHSVTLGGGGWVEGDARGGMFVAHYIGRRRSYLSLDERHEKEAKRRRRVADEEGKSGEQTRRMQALAVMLNFRVCTLDKREFEETAMLCDEGYDMLEEMAEGL
eukprot:754462-Hanusia_phi.AAC.3